MLPISPVRLHVSTKFLWFFSIYSHIASSHCPATFRFVYQTTRAHFPFLSLWLNLPAWKRWLWHIQPSSFHIVSIGLREYYSNSAILNVNTVDCIYQQCHSIRGFSSSWYPCKSNQHLCTIWQSLYMLTYAWISMEILYLLCFKVISSVQWLQVFHLKLLLLHKWQNEVDLGTLCQKAMHYDFCISQTKWMSGDTEHNGATPFLRHTFSTVWG